MAEETKPVFDFLAGQAWAIAVCELLDIDYKKHFVQSVVVSGEAGGEVSINVSFLASTSLLGTLGQLEQHVETMKKTQESQHGYSI